MNILKWFTASLYAFAVLVSCEKFPGPPPSGPGTNYPCGIDWYVCRNSPLKPAGCCRVSDVCGGDQGPNQPVICPEGTCCNEGLDVAGEMSVRRAPYPQRVLR